MRFYVDADDEVNDPSETTLRQMLRKLCELLFDCNDVVDKIIEQYCDKPSKKEKEYHDPEVMDVLDEIALNDPDNLAEFKELRSEMRKAHMRKLNETAAKNRRLLREVARAKKAKAKARARAKAKAKAKAKTARVPRRHRRIWGRLQNKNGEQSTPHGKSLAENTAAGEEVRAAKPTNDDAPVPSAQDAGNPAAELGVSGQELVRANAIEDAGEHGQSHGCAPRVVMYRTTSAIERLIPPKGVSLSIDEHSCRWRAKVHGERIASVGFGPKCTFDRKGALNHMLDKIWAHYGEERPAHPTIDEIDPALWAGQLDPRQEQPTKYGR